MIVVLSEKQAIYKNDDSRKSYDCDEGRERVGMGILLAKWYIKHPSEKLKTITHLLCQVLS